MDASDVMHREALSLVLSSAFFSSFVARAREGDLHDSDPARRSAAWAHWAVRSVRPFSGSGDRSYVGLVLPGRFHDPFRSSPDVPPHLEVSRSRLSSPDEEFPDRLAQMGNGLLFSWWVYPEVVALRRALLSAGGSSVAPLCDSLCAVRASLSDTLRADSGRFASSWPIVEHALVTDSSALAPLVLDGFSSEDVSSLVPSLAPLRVSISFEPRLREQSGDRAVRRVGVWVMEGDAGEGPMRLGVVTPRLTANSLFRDPTFDAAAESPAALLVRLLLVRRLSSAVAGMPLPGEVVVDAPSSRGRAPFLRSAPALPGSKVPEASDSSAVHFLQTFPDADAAWSALVEWSAGGFLLTVSESAFRAAHANALRFIRRAEPPRREDVNVILPMAWDSSSRVVRATFVRPSS